MSFVTVKRKGLQLLAGLAVVGLVAAGGGYFASLGRQNNAGIAAPDVARDAEEILEADPVARTVRLPDPEVYAADAPGPPAPTIAVAAMGCIQEPGMYRMPLGSRVTDLIDEAKGTTPDADLDDINIAAKLLDGATLTIPATPVRGIRDGSLVAKRSASAAELNPPEYTRSGWRPLLAAPTPAVQANPEQRPAAQGSNTGGLLDLNTASMEELETLPGIGPKTAEKIIAHRAHMPFRSVDDLRDVHGIGDKKLDAVRPFVTVR